ncbi:MAG: cytochrome c biogenesis protein CcdA [Acidobacteria bacterium]|nr:cytochrome c biogenesis protein CcdA [Acidobacteriota bacterium]
MSLVTATLLSSAWLVFPYLVQGKKLLFQVGSDVRQKQRVQAISIGQHLTRIVEGPGEAEVEVLYATPTYFEVTDRAGVVGKYQPNRYLVFVVTETTHTNRLPDALPSATLLVDGTEYAPISREGPGFAEHHRTTVYRFPLSDARGRPLIAERPLTLQFRVHNRWDGADTPRTASWQLPIQYPPELLSRKGFTPTMVLALAAGLLSAVLTPCLLQLIVVYLATLTGLSAAQVTRPGAVPADAGRRMLCIALAFVGGFSALFTVAGAVIGYAGKEIQLFLAEGSRNVSVGAGILMIAMGLWLGVKTRVPLVCKLPFASTVAKFDRKSIFGPALMAAGFSLGCMTCFSGAIIATLLIYVGALGSASVGAAVLLMFSIGVAIPFLAAALYLSRVMPVLTYLARYAPLVGLASMVVVIAFGLVLITDNLHALSSAIYPYLGLS